MAARAVPPYEAELGGAPELRENNRQKGVEASIARPCSASRKAAHAVTGRRLLNSALPSAVVATGLSAALGKRVFQGSMDVEYLFGAI